MDARRQLDDLSHLRGDGIYATVAVIAKELVARGLDPAPLLAKHGLHPPRGWLPLERAPRGSILAFMESCVEATADPGMHVAATLKAAIGAFEVADYLALMAPTLGHSLRAVCEHFDMVNSGLAFRFEDGDQEVIGRVRAVYERAPHPLEVECTLVAIEHRIRYATGGAHGLSRVALSHRDNGSGPALAKAFACPVVFEQPVDQVHIPRAGWDAPTVFRNRGLDWMMHAVAPTALPRAASAFLSRVREAVTAGVAGSGKRTEGLARQLGMSVRSLQRRLAEHGLSVGEVLSEGHKEVALRLLARPELTLAEVAEQLGYSEPSAFTRAFRRWTGLTPSDYRELHYTKGP